MKAQLKILLGVVGAFALTLSDGYGMAQSVHADPVPPPLAKPAENSKGPMSSLAVESVQNGSGFTYQGQLRKNGSPVNGACTGVFKLYDASVGGVQIGSALTQTITPTNGLFTVVLNFGWVFNGEARWLETSAGCGEAPVTLSPRTGLRTTPYAAALPGMRTVPGLLEGVDPTMNVIGGVIAGAISNTIAADSFNSVIGGGTQNQIYGASIYNAIGGGWRNTIYNASDASVIGGGYVNAIGGASYISLISGGQENLINNQSSASVIAGGYQNTINNNSFESAIVSGASNFIDYYSNNSLIGSGYTNTISNSALSAIGGGEGNAIVTARYAAIPGGGFNRVEGDYGFAAGRKARAMHDGAFVWGDSTNANIDSTASNQFIVRASGGISMFTNAGSTIGARLLPGSGSWTTISDRNMKANIASINPQTVLQAVAKIPVSTWNYTTQDPAIRHIGPMAQDFYAAFNLGEDNTGISVVDAQGVSLAAIQALKAENDELRARLERLEQAQPVINPWLWVVMAGMCLVAGAGLGRVYATRNAHQRGEQ